MTITTRSIHLPRQMDASWPGALILVASLGYIAGVVGHASMPIWWNMLSLGLLALATIYVLQRAWTWRAQLSVAWEAEASGLALVFGFVLVRTLSVWTDSGLNPLLYIILSLVVALGSRPVGLFSIVFVVALHLSGFGLDMFMGRATVGVVDGVSPALFFVIFGVLSHVIHGIELKERRHRHKQQVEQEREHMLKEAREFRLLQSSRISDVVADRQRRDNLVMRDAVDAVHHTIYVSLGLLKTALNCHTCVLLWYDLRQENLTIKELVSDADALTEGRIDPARGVIGGITRQREAVCLSDLHHGYRGLTYYRDAEPVKHFLGVPVIEHGHLRGVLCVDRVDGDAFGANEVHVLEETANYILRAVQNERLFAAVEKSKDELGRFFEASRRLNAVLTREDVSREALRSVADIAPFDLAALTLFDAETGEHTITCIESSARLSGLDLSSWQQRTFVNNQGLVSMVVKNQHYLPYGGQVRDAQVIFTSRERIDGLRSLLVLPLIVHDEAIGTLILGHKDASQYGQDLREMLEVVSHQVAISMKHAMLYAQMETMATRDGLTGLSNRRDFLQKLNAAVARHRRNDRTFGLILTDIDKFKSVNDTYGHPVGDEVLRQVSATFRRCLRESDLPGRYGGEEFIILLEDTDLDGAKILAERLREEIGQLVFDSDQGQFQRTISMGIAMWPDDHAEIETLIDLADQALYHSKTSGRNQVTAYSQMPSKG